MGFGMAVTEADLPDGFAQQRAQLVRFGGVLDVQPEPAAGLQDAVDFLQRLRLVLDPVQHAVEIDGIEFAVAKARQVFGPAGLEGQRLRLPQTRDRDPVFERIDADDAPGRADEVCGRIRSAGRCLLRYRARDRRPSTRAGRSGTCRGEIAGCRPARRPEQGRACPVQG